MDSKADKNTLLSVQFWISSEISLNSRRVFGWFDLLGKLGGITNVMMLLFGFFLYPISEHSYVLKVAKKLFIARTRDTEFFKNDPKQNIEVTALSPKVQKELDIHHPIKLYPKDNFCLYLSNRLGMLFPSFCWPKRKQFQKLYKITKDRMEKQLNIIKLIKNVRN